MDSTTTIVIAIAAAVVIVAIAIAAIAFIALRRRRSDKLRSRFGPEYERAMQDVGDRRRAETELDDRQKRVSQLDIRPLSVTERDHFTAAWQVIQAEFVDQPKQAVVKADDLLTEVMRARGYPTEDFEQRSADLSVDHPSVVQNYRAGRELAVRDQQGQAATEDLRQAMIHFRALFDELVSDAAANAHRQAS